MQLVKDTPFETGFLLSQVRPPRPSLTVVVKATFTLVHNGLATVAPVQQSCSGDVHTDDDPARSLVYESDLAVRKPRGECTLVGTCHVPGGTPQKVSGVAFKIGGVSKALAVFGDRTWVRRALVSVPGDPQPFVTMPLAWERALGGAGFDRNPVGVGINPVETATGTQNPMPNMEHPDRLVSSQGARPDPAGCGPIARNWPARAARMGTVDGAWTRTRWPAMPLDFDWAYFNAAPADQQIDGFWRGDEEIALRNLHPTLPLLHTRLPGRRARCFLVDDSRLREVPMVLDTLAVQSDQGVVIALWRGVAEVASDAMADLPTVFVLDEAMAEPLSLAACAARLAAAQGVDAADGRGFVPDPPPGLVPVVTPPVEAMPRPEINARLARGESLAGEDLSGTDLGGLDLTGHDLSRSVLTGAAMPGVVLVSAVLTRAMAAGANLAGADLTGADLAGADLTGADLTGARLTGANLTGAVLDGARLGGAVLRGAVLRGAEAHRTDFTDADLRQAVLDRADLSRAVLDRADLTEASLVECTLEGAVGVRVVMDRCDLTRLRASDGARFPDASIREARAAGSRWGGAVLDRATLSFSDLQKADFAGASLVDATLNGCRLRGARMGEAVLTGASLMKVDGMEVDLEAADLTRADLRGANLFGAALYRARTDGARLELANVTRTRLA